MGFNIKMENIILILFYYLINGMLTVILVIKYQGPNNKIYEFYCIYRIDVNRM